MVRFAWICDSVLNHIRVGRDDIIVFEQLGRRFHNHPWDAPGDFAEVLMITGGNDAVKAGPRPKGSMPEETLERLRRETGKWTERGIPLTLLFVGDGQFWLPGFAEDSRTAAHAQQYDSNIMEMVSAARAVAGTRVIWWQSADLHELSNMLLPNDYHFKPEAASLLVPKLLGLCAPVRGPGGEAERPREAVAEPMQEEAAEFMQQRRHLNSERDEWTEERDEPKRRKLAAISAAALPRLPGSFPASLAGADPTWGQELVETLREAFPDITSPTLKNRGTWNSASSWRRFLSEGFTWKIVADIYAQAAQPAERKKEAGEMKAENQTWEDERDEPKRRKLAVLSSAALPALLPGPFPASLADANRIWGGDLVEALRAAHPEITSPTLQRRCLWNAAASWRRFLSEGIMVDGNSAWSALAEVYGIAAGGSEGDDVGSEGSSEGDDVGSEGSSDGSDMGSDGSSDGSDMGSVVGVTPPPPPPVACASCTVTFDCVWLGREAYARYPYCDACWSAWRYEQQTGTCPRISWCTPASRAGTAEKVGKHQVTMVTGRGAVFSGMRAWQ